jgi:hypothetical protein
MSLMIVRNDFLGGMMKNEEQNESFKNRDL